MTDEEIAAWRTLKEGQWAACLAENLPGLSLSRSAPNETTYILGYSGPAFEDRVIVGALPIVRPIDDKRVNIPGIDRTTEEILGFVRGWRDGRRLPPETRMR